MSNILDFCYQKLNYIIDQLDMYVLKNGSQIHFYIPYSKNEKLSFTFVGAGTYGNVLRVKNLTREESIIPTNKYFIMKIMKVKHDEPDRCLKIKRVIKKIKNNNKKKKTINGKIKLDLINKYTTNIFSLVLPPVPTYVLPVPHVHRGSQLLQLCLVVHSIRICSPALQVDVDQA